MERLARIALRAQERAAKSMEQAPPTRSLVRSIVEFEAIGWHVARLRPSTSGEASALWCVTIERYDQNATMTITEANLEAALAELVRYAKADAS
jgi:hypothetical protein